MFCQSWCIKQDKKGHFPQRFMTDVAVNQRHFWTANFRSATKTKTWKFKNVGQKIWPPKLEDTKIRLVRPGPKL